LLEVEAGFIEFDAQSPIVLPSFYLYQCIFLLMAGNVKIFLHESFIRYLQPSSYSFQQCGA